MKTLVRTVVPAALMAVSLASPVEAMVRKCANVAGSGRPVSGTPLLMVDGVVVGNLPSATAPANAGPIVVTRATTGTSDTPFVYPTPTGLREIRSDQIGRIEILCLEHEIDDKLVGKQVVFVATFDGAEGMLRAYLDGLAELQEGYREANGAYAAALDYVGFYLSRPSMVSVELNAVDGGWSASATAPWTSKVCQVAVGAAAPASGWQSGVDGVRMGIFPMQTVEHPRGTIFRMPDEADLNVDPEDVLEIRMGCVEVFDAASQKMVGYLSSEISTRSGRARLVAGMEALLQDLVRRQEGFREANGRYASTKVDLATFEKGMVVSDHVSMAAVATGWSARLSYPFSAKTCVVAMGTTPPSPGGRANEIVCFGE